MRRTLGLATAAVLAAGTMGVQAADASGQTARTANTGVSAITALQQHPGAARATDGQAFRVTDTIIDKDGTSHVRMSRTIDGVPVLGGDVVVHRGPQAGWRGVSQTLAAPLDLSTTPVVTVAAAKAKALAPAAATRTITGATATGSRLVIDATSGTPRLAWEVITGGVQKDGTPSRLASYVDARTGTVIRREQQIETIDGSGQTLYSGTVPLSVTQSGSTYQLKNQGIRGNTYTTDMNNKSDSYLCQVLGSGCSTGTLITSTTTTFGNGSNTNRATAGADAQYGSNETWDFYKATFNRDGIFGNGSGSYNRVHYGSGYVNAFWDGTKMTYGDGDGTNYGPLVSLDVAGHEMSHGVTENTAGLDYSGESGGLNEATSDIFGTMVEFYAANANDPGDYLIGEEFDLKNHVGFRRMDKPSSDGASYDCWSALAGQDDVHYSSGIGNHFFYLLSEGSGAKTLNGVAYNSPTCNGSTVTGIGQAAAGNIWYRALTVYMTSSTNYSGARTATMNAARDLYGAGSAQQNAVAAAWSAVNVS
ncbi:M4 family metallopeptidase [Nocardioides sp. LS1]|uniref:M4 family metallopeptidase n=1 Tax=Nocardioides sp. LS1 TaxID=1027620 RepID=UPI000F61BD3A|nr:M4 family metallopeptidase [Nocardioides sp. LS1]